MRFSNRTRTDAGTGRTFETIRSRPHEIIENEEFDYTKDYDGNAIAISAKISSKKQKVVKILDPRKKEVIDYILNEVGDVKKIYPGHASEDNLGKETYKYLEAKLELPKRYNYI